MVNIPLIYSYISIDHNTVFLHTFELQAGYAYILEDLTVPLPRARTRMRVSLSVQLKAPLQFYQLLLSHTIVVKENVYNR